jgi:hypothetical protein
LSDFYPSEYRLSCIPAKPELLEAGSKLTAQ